DHRGAPVTSTRTRSRSPAARLGLVWARPGEPARPDGAMRRWAARDGHAAAAVATVDRQVTESVTAALGDMGFLPAQADVLGTFLTSAFAGAYHSVPDPPPADPAPFETFLEVVRH